MKYDNLKLGAILLLLSIACNRVSVGDNKKENFEVKDTSFEELILKIPRLNLPCTLFCGLDNGLPWAEELGIKNIVPEDSQILGVLPVNNNNTYIVYGIPGDIIYPYLNIYDSTGTKIDSLYLHISYCAADESEIVANITTINKDFSISMMDTTKFIHYTDDNEIIIDSIIVKKRHLNLMNNGIYKKQVQESFRIQ
jgi:hypothetical protein